MIEHKRGLKWEKKYAESELYLFVINSFFNLNTYLDIGKLLSGFESLRSLGAIKNDSKIFRFINEEESETLPSSIPLSNYSSWFTAEKNKSIFSLIFPTCKRERPSSPPFFISNLYIFLNSLCTNNFICYLWLIA